MFSPKFFFGTVEDRDDDLKLGRVRLRIDGIHPEDQTLVPTSSLPWAMPLQWLQSAAYAGVGWSPVGPMVGTRVFGFWVDGEDAQIPIMMGTIGGDVGHLSFPAVSQGADSTVTESETPTKEASNPKAKLGPVPQAAIPKAVALAQRLQKDFGLTQTQSAGVLGNFLVECPNLIPNTNQGGRKGAPAGGTSSGKGYGWAQWDNVRRKAFVDYAASKKLDVQSDEANYQFLAHELRTTEKSALKQLKATKDLDGATRIWSEKFERAGDPHMERRVASAATVYKALTSTNVPVRTTGVDEDAVGTETDETKVPDDLPPSESVGTEPIRTFRGRYPYNKSFRSESGHVTEIDDTPGHERLLTYHTVGTYEEVNEEGRRVVKVVGDNYTIIAKDDNVYVSGTVNLFVDGDVRAKIGGSLTAQITGDVGVYSEGAIKMKGASVSIESSSGDINLKSAAGLNTQGAGDVSVKSGATAYIDGTAVRFGEAGSDAAGVGSSLAINEEELSFVLDDDFDGELQAVAIAAGVLDSNLTSDITDPIVADDPSEKEPDKIISNDCDGLDALTSVPDNQKISNYFKLGDFSSHAAFPHKVISQKGLTVGQIACNLSLLAKNCIDPIKSKYPNLRITSGFRPLDPSGAGANSQHLVGQACDMQFGGVSNASLLDIAKWIRDESGIPFDQLILEHQTKNPKGKSWIHISYKKTDNRKMAFTLNNHKPYSSSQLVSYNA